MAKRPVFRAMDHQPFVQEIDVDFKYYSGFAIEQKQRSISSLHEAYCHIYQHEIGRILEVSSKSPILLGQQLSAFSLQYTMSNGKKVAVENVFQAGKCFANNAQYVDLLNVSPSEAKKDERIRNSGPVIGFRLGEESFSTYPQTYFYDWIYINALSQNPSLACQLLKYDAFTDIAFNPQKSINCQAKSAALYVALHKQCLLADALKNSAAFLQVVYENNEMTGKHERREPTQISLFDEL